MDLIIGKGQKSAILTLCERSRNYLLMARLPHGKNPEKVADMAISLLLPYRKNVLTITTDNGSEFFCHKKIAKALATTVNFADSYASWQKGAYISPQINRAEKNKSYFYNCYGKEEKFYIENQG